MAVTRDATGALDLGTYTTLLLTRLQPIASITMADCTAATQILNTSFFGAGERAQIGNLLRSRNYAVSCASRGRHASWPTTDRQT